MRNIKIPEKVELCDQDYFPKVHNFIVVVVPIVTVSFCLQDFSQYSNAVPFWSFK